MKKIFFSAVLLASVLYSCSDDDFGTRSNVEMNNGRPQINLTLSDGSELTRMTSTGTSFTFTTNDKLGAVLVDSGVVLNGTTSIVNWNISNSHVGNNQWNWVNGQFVTEGTTSIGAWLFYSRYNSDMSINRNGVEYTFPQIQEYSSDYKWLANNNVNFVVSPIYRIDGYEGEEINIPVYQSSIHSNVKLNLQLPSAVKQVQKIVLTATNAVGDPVKFTTKGRILNEKLCEANAVANMLQNTGNASYNAAYHLPHIVGNTTAEDIEDESLRAYRCLTNSSSGANAVDFENDDDNTLVNKYTEITAPINTVDFLVLDCVENHENEAADGVAVANGKFTSYMLIPAGVYKTITLYVYTDNGIYKKVVNRRDMAVKEDESTLGTDKKSILLRRHTRVNLANIVKPASSVEDDAIEIVSGDLRTADDVATELGGVIVTKTADLIAAIQGSKNKAIKFQVVNQAELNYGYGDPAVPEHSTLINKAVADAVLAKWSDARTNVNLTFTNSKMKIEGETTPYDLVAMTFNNGCELTKGSVNVAEHVYFGAGTNSFDIKSGATAYFTKGTSLNPVSYNFGSELSTVNNYGNAYFTGYGQLGRIENKNGGIVNVDKNLIVEQLKNYESINIKENEGQFTITSDWENVGTENYVYYNGTVTNNNEVVIRGEGTNGGTFINNKEVEVFGKFTNISSADVINNNKDATFIAQIGGEVTNNMGGEVTNFGELYCIIEGAKRGQISNYGTITAEGGALTYITYNQEENQSATDLEQNDIDKTKIGRIILKERGSNMSVSTANRQGIIEYTIPAGTGKWIPDEGDKFNKLIINYEIENNSISNPIDLTALNSVSSKGITKVISVEIDGENYVKFANNQKLKELIIKDKVNVLGQQVSTAILRVMSGAKLTIPTNNVFGVYGFTDGTGNAVSEENLVISNKDATILVGGRFYTSEPQSITEGNGEFASGAGTEAYIFESETDSWKNKQ